MASIYDIWQPFFQSNLQGRDALRQQKASLNRQLFDAQVQQMREQRERKQAEEKSRYGNLIDLLKYWEPKDVFAAFSGGGQYPDTSKLTGPTFPQREQSALEAYRNRQLDLDQQRINSQLTLAAQKLAAQQQETKDLKKFQLDSASAAKYYATPEYRNISENLAENRAQRSNILQAFKNDNAGSYASIFTPNGQINTQAAAEMLNNPGTSQVSKEQLDKLLTLDKAINTGVMDSTGVMNMLRAQMIGLSPTVAGQQEFSDQDIDDFDLGQ